MKAERLLAILTILLNRKKISASALARELEVSLRTVYRDIDALTEAGIPVFATDGRNGGFELVEGFTMDDQLLETGEIRQILAGLQGLTAIYSGQEIAGVIEKFKLVLKKAEGSALNCSENHIFIEITPSRREKEIIQLIEASINRTTILCIRYTDANGRETDREIESAALVFVWQSWYVWAYCRLRKDFRFFKISRINEAFVIQTQRNGPKANLSERPWTQDWDTKPFEKIVLSADKVAYVKLREFFDAESINGTDGGQLQVTALLPVDEWVVSFIMGLPGHIKVLEPESLRLAIHSRAMGLLGKNEG